MHDTNTRYNIYTSKGGPSGETRVPELEEEEKLQQAIRLSMEAFGNILTKPSLCQKTLK